MKRYLVPIIALTIGVSSLLYVASSYVQGIIAQKTQMLYGQIDVISHLQELRYHLLNIQEKILYAKHYKQIHPEGDNRLITILPMIENSRTDVAHLAKDIASLRDEEDILKRYGLFIHKTERILYSYQHTLLEVLKSPDPLQSPLFENLISIGEEAGIVLSQMEKPLNTESDVLDAKLDDLLSDLRLYQTIAIVLLISFLLSAAFFLIRFHQVRIQRIHRMIQGVREGQDEADILAIGHDNVSQGIAVELSGLIEKIREHEKSLEGLTVVDPMTGMFNRRHFQSRLDEEFKRFIRYNTLFSIGILDVDHFKKVNDTYGHQQGDVVLKEVANLIKESTRETDISARYGGEEFVILYTCTDKAGAAINLERLRRSVENHAFQGIPQKVTVSIGVSDATGKTSSEDVIRNADSALYSAKNSGRNRCLVYVSPLSGKDSGKPAVPVGGKT